MHRLSHDAVAGAYGLLENLCSLKVRYETTAFTYILRSAAADIGFDVVWPLDEMV